MSRASTTLKLSVKSIHQINRMTAFGSGVMLNCTATINGRRTTFQVGINRMAKIDGKWYGFEGEDIYRIQTIGKNETPIQPSNTRPSCKFGPFLPCDFGATFTIPRETMTQVESFTA